MSKLAHSNQETMDEIGGREAIDSGNEDLLAVAVANARAEFAPGSPCLSTPPRSVIDVAWEATEHLDSAFTRLIIAAPEGSGAKRALEEAKLMLRDYVFAELLELRMAKEEVEVEETEWPRRPINGQPWG